MRLQEVIWIAKREAKVTTWTALAEVLDITYKYVWAMMRGVAFPSLNLLVKICILADVCPDVFEEGYVWHCEELARVKFENFFKTNSLDKK